MQIIIVLLALGLAVWLGNLTAGGAQNWLMMFAAALVAGTIAFFRPKLSLVLLVFSMLLSPEIGLGGVGEGRSVVVRYDDILLLIIFLSWFARTALFKDKPFITSTPVQTPVLLYTALCVLSTAMGVISGHIDAKTSFFYVLKYVEYFLLYFMTVNIVESEEEVKKYLKYGLVVAVLVTLYAYYYYSSYSGPEVRVTAPFEVPLGGDIRESEPASLGGYYIIVFGVLMALLTESSGYILLAALGLLIFMFPAFLLTFSRASYIGFTAMIPALLFLSLRRRVFLLGFLSAGLISLALMPSISARVMDRISMTYQGVYATQTVATTASGGEIKLEESAAARIRSIKRVIFERLPKRPLFGWGVTGVGLSDTQYALVLGETGILGAILFIWMLVRLFHTARTVFRFYSSPVTKALGLGFMVSLVGLLFQAVGVNTFIIVRIMEPFWFVAAILSVLYLKAMTPQAKA
ncbi:MAG: O-antigen ligase family protein [Elusimicrobiales bacterium]